MNEGVIYSFDLAGDTGEYAISTGGSNLAIAGVSLIRHDNELSVILLAGENPPNPPDSEIHTERDSKDYRPFPGHEGISPDPSLSIQSRYLDGMTGFSKILVLTRFDLETKKRDVRYINLDVGASYLVLTDDKELFEGVFGEIKNDAFDKSLLGLKRYSQLFSALTSLIYLPVMFFAEHYRVIESKFLTQLYLNKRRKTCKNAISEFKEESDLFHRIIKCLSSLTTENLVQEDRRVIDPPPFSFESTGFWKPLQSNAIGTDKNGNLVVGKTWVKRVDSYSASSPDSFIIQNLRQAPIGDDPGVVYIIRSTAHGSDIFKVGLTRHSASHRAHELSTSTSVPLPFHVLASWEVGNCGSVEKEVHRRLKQYRINMNREFFGASLSTIVATIEQVTAENRSKSSEQIQAARIR